MPETDDLIDALKHPAVAEARRLLRGAKGQAAQAFLADGCRLVGQAVEAGAAIEYVFFLDPVDGRKASALWGRARALGLPCRRVTRGVFFRILGLGYETSVRVLAVIRRPGPADGATLTAEGTMLVGERIQDPRNVGVLVRTVDAWGLPCAVFSRDSADPWSRAAVRSSTGSIFRVPLAQPADLTARMRELKAQSVRLIGASAHASVPCWKADLTGPCALVVGNETEGLSEELKAACDALVTIPMCGGAGSLNVTVAGGILLYERARQIQAGAGPRRAD